MTSEEMNELETPRKEIVELLKEKGWRITTVGKHEVRSRGNAPMNYRYVLEFSGKPPKEKEGSEDDE